MEYLNTQLQPFFEWLLRTTVQASLLICVILLLQRILRNRLCIRWHYGLWLLLLVRMSLPWAPQSRASLFNLIPRLAHQQQTEYGQQENGEQSVGSDVAGSESVESVPASPATKTQESPEAVTVTPSINHTVQNQFKPDFSQIVKKLPLLWLIGALVLAIYVCAGNFNLWRIIKRRRPLTDQNILDLLEDCKAQMGIQTILGIVPTDKVESPALFGFVRPRLLLPHGMIETLSQQELRYILLHELAHLKRHDIYIGWLMSLLQVLHWFNPLVWLAFYRMRSDRELACDALVLARTQNEEPKSYGRIIVNLVERFSRPQRLPGMAGILETKSQLKRRVTMIAKFKKNSYQWSPLAIVLIIVLACISLPDARRTKASETTAAKPAHQPTFRKIQIPYDAFRLREAPLSPDGKSIALVLEKKLWVMPRAGKLGPDFPGAPTLLNTGDIEVAWQGLAWSGDSRWIAFHDNEWNEEEKRGGNRWMYVISVDGGKPKKVYENWRSADWLVNYRMSLSPKGKTLAFSSVDANEQHIYTIGVDGGLRKRVVEAPAREPVFSPDGKRIAYVADKDVGARGGGLWVVSADGGTPRLAADAGHATSPVWSPDGRMIAFLDREDAKQIFIIPIGEDGEPAGERVTIGCPEGVDSIRRLTAWTPDNKLGTKFTGHPQYGLYTLPATGGIVTVVAHGEESLGQPRWSPDGKRIIVTIATGKGRDGWRRDGLASVSAEGGEISTIPVRTDTKIAKQSYGGGNHVSPDGQTIVFAGRRAGQKAWWLNHIWSLPIEGGEPKQLTNAPAPLTHWYPCWSPDGKAIAFIRCKNDPIEGPSTELGIFIMSADGGEPRQLTRESDVVLFGYIAWSPDGKWLSYFSLDTESPKSESEVVLKVVPAEGGPSRVVGKLEQGFDIRLESAWSPDSKRIAFIGLPDYKVIKIMSLDDGSIVDVDPHLADTRIGNLDWLRNGDRLVFTGLQGSALGGFWTMENFLPTTVTSAAK